MTEKVVVSPSGEQIIVPSEEAAADLTAVSGHVMAPQEEQAARHAIAVDKRSSGIENGINAFSLGALRGATLGLSDRALLALANQLAGAEGEESVRQKMAELQEARDKLSTTGEVAGTLVPMMFGDEAGVANLPGLVGRVGRGAESAIARGIGTGSQLSRGAGRVLGMGVGGAIEGSIYGAGKAASDAALADEDLTGEKLVAGATHGALFGGLIGLGTGAVGHLASESLSGLRAPKQTVQTTAANTVPAARGTIADELQKLADVKTIKALGGSAGDFRALERNVPGGYRRVAQDIRSDIESSTGKSIGRQSREELHEYAVARREELGNKLGSLIEKLDQANTGAPDAAAFGRRVQKELIDPNTILRADGVRVIRPGAEKQVEAVQSWVERMNNAFDRSPTFAEWQKMRVSLQDEIKWNASTQTPATGALKQLRAIMENELETSGERAAQAMGGSFRDEYRATKSLYQSVTKAEELTERGVSRQLTNNSLGLRATMAGLTGFASAANPVAGLATGAAMAAIGKINQNYGDVLAADLLSRVATIAGAQRIATRVTGQMQAGVSKLVPSKASPISAIARELAAPARAAAAPLGVVLTHDRRKDFEKISNTVATASANPAAVTDRVSKSLGDLPDHAPHAASAAIETTLRGLQFLAGKMPPSKRDPYSIQPQFEPETRASDAEISRFMRYAQAVDDPLLVLEEAKAGTLSRDHVEAVKAVYPALYDEMRSTVARSLIESSRELPYSQLLQIGILLDIPTHKTLSPDFLRAVQATYTDAEKAGAETPPPTGAAPEIASTVQTATQSAVARAE